MTRYAALMRFYSYTASLIYLFLIKTKTILKYLRTILGWFYFGQSLHELLTTWEAFPHLLHYCKSVFMLHYPDTFPQHEARAEPAHTWICSYQLIQKMSLTSLANEPSANFYQCLLSYFSMRRFTVSVLKEASLKGTEAFPSQRKKGNVP